MLKCKIQWIDDQGKPTPDNNDAIGLAVCITPDTMYYDLDTLGHVRAFPICAEHAKQIHPTWRLVRFAASDGRKDLDTRAL